MTIGTATTDQRYAAKSRCNIANRAIEALTLTNNPAQGVIDAADAAGTAAIVALSAAGIAGGGNTDPTKALVSNGDSIPLLDSNAAAIAAGTAQIAGSAVTSVTLASTNAVLSTGTGPTVTNSGGSVTAPSTATVTAGVATVKLGASKTIVSNADTVTITDAAGSTTASGVATITAGNLTKVAPPSTSALHNSGTKYTGPAITGSYVNGYTFTIVNGAITAIVAS